METNIMVWQLYISSVHIKLIQRHSWSLVESSLRALFQLSAFHSAIVQLFFFFFGGGGGFFFLLDHSHGFSQSV